MIALSPLQGDVLSAVIQTALIVGCALYAAWRSRRWTPRRLGPLTRGDAHALERDRERRNR